MTQKFSQKDLRIPQVALDLDFEDESFRGDPFAYMVNERLGLGLCVSTGEYQELNPKTVTKRYTVVKTDENGQFYGPDDIVLETDFDLVLSDFVSKYSAQDEDEAELEREFQWDRFIASKEVQEKIKRVAQEAEEAFWAKVAENYPEAQSGDLGWDASCGLSNMMEATIRLWVRYNVPLKLKEVK